MMVALSCNPAFLPFPVLAVKPKPVMNNIFLKILVEERMHLLEKLSVIEQAIGTYKTVAAEPANGLYVNLNSLLNTPGESFFQKYSGYNMDASTRNKILFIIKTENRFLHVREIARIMQLMEEGETLQQAIKKISPALSFLKKLPDTPLTSVAADGLHFNTFWGYKHWITDEGEIDGAFMYNESEITKKKRQLSA
jgi:hypothetical protein